MALGAPFRNPPSLNLGGGGGHKSSGGSVDTTKTRSGPQRVSMSSGERPIGAAKGKQSDTEALCHPPPPPTQHCHRPCFTDSAQCRPMRCVCQGACGGGRAVGAVPWGTCRGGRAVGGVPWGTCRGGRAVGDVPWGTCRGGRAVGDVPWGTCRGGRAVGDVPWGTCRGGRAVGDVPWGTCRGGRAVGDVPRAWDKDLHGRLLRDVVPGLCGQAPLGGVQQPIGGLGGLRGAGGGPRGIASAGRPAPVGRARRPTRAVRRGLGAVRCGVGRRSGREGVRSRLYDRSGALLGVGGRSTFGSGLRTARAHVRHGGVADPSLCGTPTRLATSTCRLRHDRMEQGPTEPQAGRSTFLLSSGGGGGAGITEWPLVRGPSRLRTSFPCRTLVACLTPTPRGEGGGMSGNISVSILSRCFEMLSQCRFSGKIGDNMRNENTPPASPAPLPFARTAVVAPGTIPPVGLPKGVVCVRREKTHAAEQRITEAHVCGGASKGGGGGA